MYNKYGNVLPTLYNFLQSFIRLFRVFVQLSRFFVQHFQKFYPTPLFFDATFMPLVSPNIRQKCYKNLSKVQQMYKFYPIMYKKQLKCKESNVRSLGLIIISLGFSSSFVKSIIVPIFLFLK